MMPLRALRHPIFPAAAFGAGVWLSAEPSRIGRVRANFDATLRAGRLATTCVAVAREYRAARSWSSQVPAELQAFEQEHLRLQLAAGRAERKRAELAAEPRPSPAALAAATEEARTTREVAVQAGEAYAARAVSHGRNAGGESRWHALHQRCASRLLELCVTNGGVYVKLGQHVAQLDYLVPEAYTSTLSALFQSNRPSSIEAVIAVVEEDFGRPLHTLFASFEPDPIASASLAQVHRATERASGRPVAVKVQHQGLRESSAADMAAVGLAVAFASWCFKDDFRCVRQRPAGCHRRAPPSANERHRAPPSANERHRAPPTLALQAGLGARRAGAAPAARARL